MSRATGVTRYGFVYDGKTVIDRISERIRVSDSGCWEWTGSTNHGTEARSNGVISFWGKQRLAHRVVYEIVRGPIPDGLVLDHLCRNPICCNVYHLEAVTQRENILRGVGACAKNAVKTHCVNGHELSGDNVYLERQSYGRPGLGRRCRACHRIRERARKQRLRDQAASS